MNIFGTGTHLMIYYFSARYSRRKKFEKDYKEYLFQEHMRKMNRR